MINHRGHREHGVKEFAGGYIKTSEGVVKDRGVGAHLKRHAGAYTGTLIFPVLGTGVGALIDVARKRPNIVKTSEMEPAVSDKTAALLGLRGPVLMGSNLKPALRELAARSGRIVEFGDGEADEAVIAALKAAASADESPAQRAMLLKRGLIEMVKGQLVINERGYDMMKKAGVPPKLTPEERREEIMGTEEEKRLSRFNHGGHGVEFGSMGLARLARVQDALPKSDSLLVKNGYKLKQSKVRSTPISVRTSIDALRNRLIPASRRDYPRSLGGQEVFFARGGWLPKLAGRVSAAGGLAGKVPQNVINPIAQSRQIPLRGSGEASELAGAARWVKNNIRGR